MARDEVERIKRQAYRKDGRTSGSELDEAKREYQNALETEKRDFNRREEKLREANKARSEQAVIDYRNKTEKETGDLRETHRVGMGNLQQKYNEVAQRSQDNRQTAAEARAKAVQDYEAEFINDRRRAQDDFEQQLLGEKRQSNAKVESTEVRSRNALLELEQKTAEQAINLQKAHGQEKLDIIKDKERVTSELIKQRDFEKERTFALLSKQREETDAQRDLVLDKQGKAFSEQIRKTGQVNQIEMDKLRDKVVQMQTKPNIRDIPPAIEERLRRKITAEYENAMASDREVADRRIDLMRQDFVRDRRETASNAQDKEAKIRHSNMEERERERAEFLKQVNEVKSQKEQAIAEMERTSKGRAESQERAYMIEQVVKKRQMEETIQAMREENQARMREIVETNEFERRAEQRENSFKMNDLIRDYEKKLNEQKDDYETVLREMKAEQDKTLRDADRRFRMTLDDQARSYEHRIQQSELSFKERERYMTAKSEVELEKMRRTNAKIIQKKS
jgi:hypothetical protein